MVALSDTEAGRQSASGVNRGGRIFFGSVLVISALGLWAVPVADGDAAMRLIKLLVSMVLAGVGVMFFLSLDRGRDLPEIQLDTAKRELRIIKHDSTGTAYVDAVHSFDALSEVSIQDRLLTARDDRGNLVASVPLRDTSTEAALKEALNRAA